MITHPFTHADKPLSADILLTRMAGVFAGLPVHLGVGGRQLRVDEAGDPVHQE